MESQQILKTSIMFDCDGCLFNDEFSDRLICARMHNKDRPLSDKQVKKIMTEVNSFFFTYLIMEIPKGCEEVELMLNSLRQCYAGDQFNILKNEKLKHYTISAFKAMLYVEEIFKELLKSCRPDIKKVYLNRLTLTDTLNKEHEACKEVPPKLVSYKPGKNFNFALEKIAGERQNEKLPVDYNDPSKLLISYHMFQSIAQVPTKVLFCDDREDLLGELSAFYNAYPQAIPRHLCVQFIHFEIVKRGDKYHTTYRNSQNYNLASVNGHQKYTLHLTPIQGKGEANDRSMLRKKLKAIVDAFYSNEDKYVIIPSLTKFIFLPNPVIKSILEETVTPKNDFIPNCGMN